MPVKIASDACASGRFRAYDSPKRVVDFIVSLTALVVLSPIFIVVAVLVRARLGSPVLFRQERPGLGERPFEMIKFRTMRDALDPDGVSLPDSVRLTSFGRWLRSTSLDELPGLWNVLKGDMSLVGPRPLLMEYIPYYTNEERARHWVRPGLTGLAQVNGRNMALWEDKFKMDIYYVNNRSASLDIKIVIRTVCKIIFREGILEKAPQGALNVYRAKERGSE